MDFWQKLLALDRRYIFVLVALALLIPLFITSPSGFLKKIDISPPVRSLYDYVEKLPPGSKVMIAFDYDPPTTPELQPMAVSFLKHCFMKDLKVIMIGLWPQGPVQAQFAMENEVLVDEKIKAKNLKYGLDYVNLGFQAGNEFVILRMGTDIAAAFPADYFSTRTKELPLMKDVKNFDNIRLIYNLSAGYPGTYEWVIFAGDRFGVKIAGGNTAVQYPHNSPYLQTGQLVGLLGGMQGAAGYEKVSGYLGKATRYMFSQAVSHAMVVLLIIIGNVAYFITRGRKT